MMELKAHLIYKSNMTYLETILSVYFYGLPNGKIVCVYAQLSEKENNMSGLEFLLAEHEDFIYDYHSEEIYIWGFKKITIQEFMNFVDQPQQRTKSLKVHSDFHSYAEAKDYLNVSAKSMVNSFAIRDIIF